jgi:hypothetical protein
MIVVAGKALARSDAAVRGRQRNLLEEREQAEEERRHRGDEQDGDRDRRIEGEEGAQKQNRNHRADEESRRRAQRDGAPDQPRAARKRRQLPLDRSRLLIRRPIETPLEHPRAIDDAIHSIGHHGQDRSDTGQEEDRRHGELDDLGDRADFGDVGDCNLRHGATICES